PLKPANFREVSFDFMKTPRPNGRGPIEAVSNSSLTQWLQRLRVRTDAAPLKRRHVSVLQRHRLSTPRPNGRGPIEAIDAVLSPHRTTWDSASERTRPH